MNIVFNILLSPFLYNNTMYTMAALVSTASALHFMVKVTFTFILCFFLWKSTNAMNDNEQALEICLQVKPVDKKFFEKN